MFMMFPIMPSSMNYYGCTSSAYTGSSPYTNTYRNPVSYSRSSSRKHDPYATTNLNASKNTLSQTSTNTSSRKSGFLSRISSRSSLRSTTSTVNLPPDDTMKANDISRKTSSTSTASSSKSRRSSIKSFFRRENKRSSSQNTDLNDDNNDIPNPIPAPRQSMSTSTRRNRQTSSTVTGPRPMSTVDEFDESDSDMDEDVEKAQYQRAARLEAASMYTAWRYGNGMNTETYALF